MTTINCGVALETLNDLGKQEGLVDTVQVDLIQADAVVLTEDEYFALCERMYRKGFERGRCA